MKKNLIIVLLALIVVCFGYLGIYQKQQADRFELELHLTQKALYALEVGLEGAQYHMGFDGNPNNNSNGLYVFDDYLECENTYKSRIQYFGLDFPLVIYPFEESAKIADSYDGYELEKVHVFDR